MKTIGVYRTFGGSYYFGDIFRGEGMISQSEDRHEPEEAFVPVVFAGDKSEAEFYKSLLDDYGLIVRIEEDISDEEGLLARSEAESEGLQGEGKGIAVLVPHGNLSEAQDIIERYLKAEDEFDEEFEDADDDDYDGFEEIDPDLE